MGFFSFLSEAASMADLWRNRRSRMMHLSRYTQDVMRADSPLSQGEREMIAAYVSGLNQCSYCHGTHVVFAEAHGVPADTLDALLTDLDAAPVDGRLKPILRYCRKLTETPHAMVKADALAVFDAGWPEAALEDAIHVTALFALYNRLIDGHGIVPRDLDTVRQRADFIKTYGFDFTTYPPEYQP